MVSMPIKKQKTVEKKIKSIESEKNKKNSTKKNTLKNPKVKTEKIEKIENKKNNLSSTPVEQNVVRRARKSVVIENDNANLDSGIKANNNLSVLEPVVKVKKKKTSIALGNKSQQSSQTNIKKTSTKEQIKKVSNLSFDEELKDTFSQRMILESSNKNNLLIASPNKILDSLIHNAKSKKIIPHILGLIILSKFVLRTICPELFFLAVTVSEILTDCIIVTIS